MSMCLGIATMTGAMSTVVKSHTAIPCRHTEIFTTHVDYGSCVSIDIYEGETVVVKENNFLGTFVLRGIPPLRAGNPQNRSNLRPRRQRDSARGCHGPGRRTFSRHHHQKRRRESLPGGWFRKRNGTERKTKSKGTRWRRRTTWKVTFSD
jgi:molecular chaperone DnaK (HSP70)